MTPYTDDELQAWLDDGYTKQLRREERATRMQAYVMYDKELSEWYVSIHDGCDYANSQQFFGYASAQDAEDDIPLLIMKMRRG